MAPPAVRRRGGGGSGSGSGSSGAVQRCGRGAGRRHRPAAAAAAPAAALLMAVLLAAPAAALFNNGLVITPSEFNTCSNSTSDSAPKISRVETCARASVSGTGTSTAFSFTSSNANVVRVASDACGDAVAGSLGELCAGADPMATIFNMARTCATAMAALYTKSVTSNAVFDMGVGAVKGRSATKEGRLTACGSGCSNAQGAAEAFAQAAACGVARATDSCMAATEHVKTQAFSRAFVKSTADAWSRACADDVGAATSGGETIAVAAAGSIAKAMAAVAAQACANCATCRCKRLPLSFNWNDAGDFSDAASQVAAGRVGLARAIAGATTTYCRGNGTIDSAKANAGAIMGTFADLVVGALGAVRGSARAAGASSWACGSGTLESDLSAVQEAAGEVLADAAGIVFDSWCPRASARFQELKLNASDALQRAVNKTAERCTGRGVGVGDGFSKLKLGGQATDLVALLKTGHLRPLQQRVADALTEAKSCGCSGLANACLWCDRGEALRRPPPAPAPVPVEAILGNASSAGGDGKKGLLFGDLLEGLQHLKKKAKLGGGSNGAPDDAAAAGNLTSSSALAEPAVVAAAKAQQQQQLGDGSSSGSSSSGSGIKSSGIKLEPFFLHSNTTTTTMPAASGSGSGGKISISSLGVGVGSQRKNLTASELLTLAKAMRPPTLPQAAGAAKGTLAGILSAASASLANPVVTTTTAAAAPPTNNNKVVKAQG